MAASARDDDEFGGEVEAVIKTLCATVLHLFFSSIRVHNVDRLPNEGAALLVANHHSSLVDPAILIAKLPRTPRFLAKSVLWDRKYLPLLPFLRASKAIPVYRRRDGDGDNDSMFASCREALRRGEIIALFGEGTSHDLPGLLDLKTGAARIVLGVGTPVSIVPVGLIYDDRARYRSHVNVYLGEAIEVLGSSGGDHDRDAVLALTAALTDELAEVAPSWESWRQHDDARVAARLTVAARPGLVYGEVITTLNNKVDAGAAGVERMCDAVEAFEDEVDRIGIDIDVVADEPRDRVESLNRRSLVESALWWPIVSVGRLLNLVPFLAVRWAADRRDLNFQATSKILFGLLLYPTWWLLLGFVVGWMTEPVIGGVVAIVAPALGYVSARVSGKLRHIGNRLRVESFREIDPEAGSALVARRSAVIAATAALLDSGASG